MYRHRQQKPYPPRTTRADTKVPQQTVRKLAIRNSYHLLQCRYSVTRTAPHCSLCDDDDDDRNRASSHEIDIIDDGDDKNDTLQNIRMSSTLRWQIICKHNFVECARMHATSKSTYANREQSPARVACNICQCEKSHIRGTINHGGNFTVKIESFRRFAFCDNSTLMVAQCSLLICRQENRYGNRVHLSHFSRARNIRAHCTSCC